jgi:hypothetical protein
MDRAEDRPLQLVNVEGAMGDGIDHGGDGADVRPTIVDGHDCNGFRMWLWFMLRLGQVTEPKLVLWADHLVGYVDLVDVVEAARLELLRRRRMEDDRRSFGMEDASGART